jgi:Cof subfamily protein (haloacid dehalogenase superfamily)
MALIAIDMDGTLLDAAGLLTARTAAAVRAAAELGHTMVIATGRPPHLVTQFGDELAGAVGYVVATNGSIVSTFPARAGEAPEILHLLSFEAARARRIIGDIRASGPGFGFAYATDAGFAHEPGFAQRMPAAVHDAPVSDVLALAGESAFKVLVFHDERDPHELLDELPAVVNANPNDEPFAVSHMGASAVEVGPATTDKSAGLRWLCDHLGVEQRDVIAIGDELNDLTMIEWASTGVAVANADAHVLGAADVVVGHHDEEGVADYLEQLVKSRSRLG